MTNISRSPVIALIAAMSRNRVIGRNNAMPWRMASDLAYFKRATMGKPVILGRKTWESIAKPLPGRDMIIVSRQKLSLPETLSWADSIEAAIALAVEKTQQTESDEIIIMGGADIYAQTLDKAGRIYLTVLDMEVEGDSFFPKIDENIFTCTSTQQQKASTNDDADMEFRLYERRSF